MRGDAARDVAALATTVQRIGSLHSLKFRRSISTL